VAASTQISFSPSRFVALTASLLGVALALDLYLGLRREVKYDPHEYFGTDTNAVPILAGSLLAFVVLNRWLTRTLRCLSPWALPALLLLPALAHHNDTFHPSLVTVAGTGLTLVALIGVVTSPRGTTGSFLAARPMRWLGERSYSIYLWNVLARIAILSALGRTVIGDLAWIAMVVVLAEASFRFVERPLRARWARRRETTVVVPGATTVQSA
jgi:peptidoglycan/LPS O-acetylase OafA/YrhL